MDTQPRSDVGKWLRSRTGLALVGFLGIVAFFLLTEHTAHVFGVLPYLLLLLCPLLHFFMHGGHGDRSDHSRHGSPAEVQGPRAHGGEE